MRRQVENSQTSNSAAATYTEAFIVSLTVHELSIEWRLRKPGVRPELVYARSFHERVRSVKTW
jgi:hypothetical protein